MQLTDPLPIMPFTRPVRGEVALPGSKSITNRALLLAALCDGPVTLTGALFSEDTEIMAEALRKLGFSVEENAAAKAISVGGLGGKIPAKKAELDVGLAGTAARFLTALCAASPEGEYVLDGTPQMRKRPMKGLIDALRVLGADIRCPGEEGFFPIEIRARGLRGGSVEIDASESSQMLSALLMVGPMAPTNVHVKLAARVREPFVAMTKRIMQRFGAVVMQAGDALTIFSVPQKPYRLLAADLITRTGVYEIEPDATAASYFLALPLVAGGALKLRGLADDSLQGDVRFAKVLGQISLGCAIEPRRTGGLGPPTCPPEPWRRRKPGEGGPPVPTFDFGEFSDTFLTLAAIAPLIEGPTRITGIAHTRRQETDRVAGMARELTKLGQNVEEAEDSLTIRPKPLKPGQVIETYGDHRFAMSFAILGCHDLHGDGKPWLSIKDPRCCAKTFPDFFEVLDGIRSESNSAS
jgi:3-phosphoshikimate 1-carboxyvinyltransferase